MSEHRHTLTRVFRQFVTAEQSGGRLLLASTVAALALANSPWGASYAALWDTPLLGLSLSHWINDGLMAIFFLLIGLELERELYVGELSDWRRALLPIVAAIGGMVTPALVHFALNAGMPTARGFGIPMATDIAFALAVLAMLGSRVPASLKVFVVAYAVIDDLGAIVVIAAFYTTQLSPAYLAAALVLWAGLLTLNLRFRIMSLLPYLLGGALMWVCMLRSGIHATIAGVLLAFAIPFRGPAGMNPDNPSPSASSPSHRMEQLLHTPVAFLVLPLFALSNTAVAIAPGWLEALTSSNSLGILAGLVAGKPVGIAAFALAAVAAGLCRLPDDLRWSHLIGAGMLGGIGFTMSIFITNLAFETDTALINGSKIAILLASVTATVLGFLWLRLTAKQVA